MSYIKLITDIVETIFISTNIVIDEIGNHIVSIKFHFKP